ncbi:hypothetical protein L596_011264 [Steinernema carpocapsae]|uniref:Cytosolic fatty-acid binding proteins domain-containing protein n=1 Tax=Steinernema carpocapsae TaxID=34508 RepID=A0A4U5NTA3_STECR|nr:hypothetical protein L596_011264 [Steinernema carpocapsae]
MEVFLGKWNFVSSDNFDAYLKHVGVGMVTRKIASALKPELKFEQDGDKWVMTSTSTFKVIETKITLGAEESEHTADGRHMKWGLHLQIMACILRG